jgi:hypothetical protein
MKKRAIQEMYDTLSDICSELAYLRGQLASLTPIRDDLAVLKRTQQSRAQFVAEVKAVQRPPDSADLQMAKNAANLAGAVLRRLEWSGKDSGTKTPRCPICHAAKVAGHVRDCTLFQVVGPPRLADTESDDAEDEDAREFARDY